MSNIPEVEYIGNNAIVSVDDVAFTFQSSENPREFKAYRSSSKGLDWTDRSFQVGSYTVFPYGENNDLPKQIKDVIQSNDSAPGKLTKKTQLLWGKGPMLYKETLIDGEYIREWVEDKEVKQWLESFNFEDYLLKCCVDYHALQGTNTKFYKSKSSLIGGRNFFAKLEHLNPNQARLGVQSDLKIKEPTHCIYSQNQIERNLQNYDYKIYPLFNLLNPFKYDVSVLYSNMYSFCSDYYTVPDIYGSLEWLRLSTTIPLIFKAQAKNSINLKYHIISPNKYWENVEEELREKCKEENKTYKFSMLQEYRTAYLKKIGKVLSGMENTGKFWHSVKYVEIDGVKIFEHGWEIKPLDQKILDFVNAQVKIWETSNRALGGNIGFHSSLGGGSETGKTDSGSEQIYALKNYLMTGIDIPEMVICKPINYALKANWPEKGLKIGFYHIPQKAESEINSKDRIKEKV